MEEGASTSEGVEGYAVIGVEEARLLAKRVAATDAALAEVEESAEALPPSDPPTPEEITSLPLTTAAALAEEEVPPEPPLSAAPGGPRPPEGLRHDYGWERTVVPRDPNLREWERIRDVTSLVPLPLSEDAVKAWQKTERIWYGERGEHRKMDYLLRKGAVGALAWLYPGLAGHARFRSPQDFYALCIQHGFPQTVAAREAQRRQKTLDGVTEPAVAQATATMQEREDEHAERKDEFSKAFVEAQKRRRS